MKNHNRKHFDVSFHRHKYISTHHTKYVMLMLTLASWLYSYESYVPGFGSQHQETQRIEDKQSQINTI